VKIQPKMKNKFSFEVDFEYFDLYFWPKVFQRFHSTNITSNAVWTEIYSYIKGSSRSHSYAAHYLPEKHYATELDNRKSIWTKSDRVTIFEIFCMYERWKIAQGAYDLLDVVNYILSQMRYGRYKGTPIHFMMVDEVQDLPHAVLLLLSIVTEQGIYFAGDTAQNIASGVGFRFCDLAHIFDQVFPLFFKKKIYKIFKIV
jgi:hypothetical protein